MARSTRSIAGVALTAIVAAAGLAACGGQPQQATSSPSFQTRQFALTPKAAAVKASFLTGVFENMQVTEVVEEGTGRIVTAPTLKGTLKLRNTSEDRAARLIGGKIEYVDVDGRPIRAEGRQDTSFRWSSYQTERLDPGMETSQSVEVPFPAAALKDRRLRDIRLELAYIPTPYRVETISVEVSIEQ